MKLRQRALVYLVATLMVTACVSTVEAQGRRGAQGGRGGAQAPGGRGGFGGGFGGMQRGGFGGFGMSGELGLLQRDDVGKELELLDDQKEELGKIDTRSMMGDLFSGMQGLSQEERGEKMRSAMAEIQKKTRAKIDDILLPHQAKRLRQIAVQASMRSADGLSRGTLADELNLTEEEREKLRTKARELRLEMEKKLVADLLKTLPASKQTKVKQLAGPPFKFVDQPRERGPATGRRRGN